MRRGGLGGLGGSDYDLPLMASDDDATTVAGDVPTGYGAGSGPVRKMRPPGMA
jgi:hypothetical protein